jgi:hypothetical protein
MTKVDGMGHIWAQSDRAPPDCRPTIMYNQIALVCTFFIDNMTAELNDKNLANNHAHDNEDE